MADIVILCNESGLTEGKAPLGQHATLAYICAAIAQGHRVLLIDHSRDSLQSCLERDAFPALVFDQSNFRDFVSLYQERNQILSDLTKNAGAELLTSSSDAKWNEVADREIVRVRDIIAKRHGIKADQVTPEMIAGKTDLSTTGLKHLYVLNRLDPMLASFKEEDRTAAMGSNVYQYFLTKYKELIPGVEFSDPSGKCDKIAPEEVDAARIADGREPIYTPTSKTRIDEIDSTLSQALEEALIEESKLFPRAEGSKFADLPQRIVFKPIDSAQSSGVCGMEFRRDGLTLSQLRQIPIMKLISEDLQLLFVQEDSSPEELKEIAKILLYAQALKEDYPEASKSKNKLEKPADLKELSDTTAEEMAFISKKLYETEVLVQPFLVGVAQMGDVRVNFVSDANGNWSIAGHTFRAQLKKTETKEHETKYSENELQIGSRFTTCFSAGKAAPTRVEYMLSPREVEAFNHCADGLLWALNGPLKHQYLTCQELGVDLVPVGDGLNFKIGEINHTDPALAPVSAALRKGAYDLAVEIAEKPEPNRSLKEQNFVQSYEPIMSQEARFVSEEYRGGLGFMMDSITNALERQDRARSAVKENSLRSPSPSNTMASECCTGFLSGRNAEETAEYELGGGS